MGKSRLRARTGQAPATPRVRTTAAGLVLLAWSAWVIPASAASLEFFENAARDYDYGRQVTLPAGFGDAEFTLEIWLRPDDALPVGPTDGGDAQLTNWSDANPAPYSSNTWWYSGNFLLDGHNNTSFSSGTFSLQFFNGGRLRWLLGDGDAAAARSGGLHAVQNAGSASLLDGEWHQVSLVRRAQGAGAQLEMWIDGELIATETTSSLTDMRQWWNTWSGFPSAEAGWIWGSEKQAAIGAINQYEDYKGRIDELRFWSRARSSAELEDYTASVTGAETGLAAHYDFTAQDSCSRINAPTCITQVNLKAGAWSADEPPLDTEAPSVPGNLSASAPASNRVELSWSAASDNIRVSSYLVYRDGTLLDTTSGTNFSDGTVSANTLYSYRIAARDEAGNDSAQSAAVSITTPVAGGGSGGDGSGNGGGGGGGGGALALEWILAALLGVLVQHRPALRRFLRRRSRGACPSTAGLGQLPAAP